MCVSPSVLRLHPEQVPPENIFLFESAEKELILSEVAVIPVKQEPSPQNLVAQKIPPEGVQVSGREGHKGG